MFIVDGISSIEDVRVDPASGVDCAMAMWASRSRRYPRGETTRLIRESMPSDIVALDRGLNSTDVAWPLALLPTLTRLSGSGLDQTMSALMREPESALIEDIRSIALSAPTPGDARTQLASRVDSMRTVLRGFCHSGFSRAWAEHQTTVDRHLASVAQTIQGDPARMLAVLSARTFHDRANDRIIAATGGDPIHVRATSAHTLRVVPCTWTGGDITAANSGDQITITVGLTTPQGAHAPAHETIENLVQALGREHAFRIMTLCMESALSTEDLCRMLNLTSAPVSRNVKRLEVLGILEARRDGRYVRYSTVIEQCQELGTAIRELPASTAVRTAARALSAASAS